VAEESGDEGAGRLKTADAVCGTLAIAFAG
jgi:hypothetical protein